MASAEQQSVASTLTPNVPFRLCAITFLLHYLTKMQRLCLSDIRKFGLIVSDNPYCHASHCSKRAQMKKYKQVRVGISYGNVEFFSCITSLSASFHFKDEKRLE